MIPRAPRLGSRRAEHFDSSDALELKHEHRVPRNLEGLSDRRERIELTVEATAVEVERIAEANRFMSNLLAERSDPPMPTTRPERVITPH